MRHKKLISTVAIIAFLAAGGGYAYYTQQTQHKEQLVMETFAPHFQQVDDLKTRIKGQLKLQFVASNTPVEQQEALFAIVDQHIEAISDHIMTLVLETYAAGELKAKLDFESGPYMDAMVNANSEINVAIKVYAQHLNRLGTLDQLRDNFEQEKGADELREVITKLSNDTITPDQERLEMIADELNIPKQQATPVLILLALSKQAIEMQNHYLNPTFTNVDEAYIADAKRFIALNQLDTILENNNILTDASAANFDNIRQELTHILAAVVAKHIDYEMLKKLNTYFETDKAQAILKKDIALASQIGPQIKTMIATMQNDLQTRIAQQHQAAAEQPDAVETTPDNAPEQAEETPTAQ